MDMNKSHLRYLHELNRENPHLDPPGLYREYHFQRLDELQTDDDVPQLLFHVFPESTDEGVRLIDLKDLEQLPVPAIRRGEFEPDRILEYPETYWNRATASFETNRDLRSESLLYDTGFFETVGSGLCYPLDAASDIGYAISSQDLEQSLVATVQFFQDLLPADHREPIYVVLSGVNLDNVTMDQYRRVDRAEQLSDAQLTSRLTPVDFTTDETLRDQVSPVLRPFWYSQTRLRPDTYYTDDGEWEFADNVD